MLVISIDLWKYGCEDLKKNLGTLRIINEGTGTHTRGDYRAEFIDKNGRKFKTTTLKDWPRKARSVWQLLKAVLS